MTQMARLIVALLIAAAVILKVTACGAAPAPAAPTPPGPSQGSVAPSNSTPCLAGGQQFCVANPNVTQATIRNTICVKGWTATIRPPVSYTDQLKRSQMQVEGLAGSMSGYEEDHRLPLELGGDPRDAHNLSPEAHPGSYVKDADENSFKAEVCSGKLTLLDAQTQFIAKWLGPYPVYRA